MNTKRSADIGGLLAPVETEHGACSTGCDRATTRSSVANSRVQNVTFLCAGDELNVAAVKLERAEAALEAALNEFTLLARDIRTNSERRLTAKSEEDRKLREIIDGLEKQQAALKEQQDVALRRVRELEQRRDVLEARLRGE
jgi:hypothetical protein